MRLLSALLLLLVGFAASPALAQEGAEEVAQDVEGAMPAVQAQGTPTLPVQPPSNAFLLVTVNVGGASIILDADHDVTAPASALRVPSGEHTLRVTAEGYGAFEQSIQVPAEGARVDVFLAPNEAHAARLDSSEDSYESSDDSPVHKKWWFWAAIGGGVVVVAGVITAIAVASGGDDGQQVIPVPPIPGGP